MGERLKTEYSFKWITTTWRYLGVHIPLNLSELFKHNHAGVYREVYEQLKEWSGMVRSWMDQLNLVKSFIFPRFLFQFHALPIKVLQSDLNMWQRSLNNFIWNGKHLHINMSIMQSPFKKGGFGMPDLKLDYQVSQLVRCYAYACPETI